MSGYGKIDPKDRDWKSSVEEPTKPRSLKISRVIVARTGREDRRICSGLQDQMYMGKERRAGCRADRRAEVGRTKPVSNPEIVRSQEAPKIDLGRSMDFQTFKFHVRSLQGRILTILDASIPEGKQHKALRSLVSAEIYEQIRRGRDLCYGGLVEPSTMPEIGPNEETCDGN